MESSANAQVAASVNPRRGPKSRNGCLRCKKKRLKCDETQPACAQCTRKNVDCPGYKSKSLVWSTKHEKLMAHTSDDLKKPLSTLPQPSFAHFSPGRPINEDATQTTEAPISGKLIVSGELSPVMAQSPSRAMPSTRRDSSQFTDSLSAIRQQLHQSTVPEFLLHLPTMLVEYYFNYVCQIFSSFDGSLNPFRATVGKLWDGSAPIYYAIQSMAAAYLANHFPRMLPVGAQMQRETYRCLYQAQQSGLPCSENLDKRLLTVLLVGQTTAWHNPKDLGLVHLKTAKKLNRHRLQQQTSQQIVEIDSRTRRQNEFFQQCILYWDMLAGYVEDDVDEFGFGEFSITEINSPTDASTSQAEKEQVFPHPWTGVSPQVQKLFAQVGRLLRHYRRAIAQDSTAMNMLSLELGFDVQYPQDSLATLEAISKAQSLEEELLAFEPPSISRLVDAGDENTPVQQYIYLAEAYRCAALLEIYRIFPSILLRRVPPADSSYASSSSAEPNPEAFNFLPISTSQAPDDFLVSLAIHTVLSSRKVALEFRDTLSPTNRPYCRSQRAAFRPTFELRFSFSFHAGKLSFQQPDK